MFDQVLGVSFERGWDGIERVGELSFFFLIWWLNDVEAWSFGSIFTFGLSVRVFEC